MFSLANRFISLEDRFNGMHRGPCVLRQADSRSRSDDHEQAVDADRIDLRHLWKLGVTVRVPRTVGTYRQVEHQKERLVEAASFSSEAMLLKNYANSVDRECGSYTCISRMGGTPAQAQPHAHVFLCSTRHWATPGRSIF